MSSLERDAHAVLLPVAGELYVTPWLRDLLEHGTLAVLSGETRDEYVAREMGVDRRRDEKADQVRGFTRAVADVAGGSILVAVDQEPWGTARLHSLVPQYPTRGEWGELSDREVFTIAAEVGTAARDLGVNMFLAPVLDVLTGSNPWLEGRTLNLPADEVARIAGAFVEGVQSVGVVAVAKHFPGYPSIAKDPAISEASVDAAASSPADIGPFASVVKSGVLGVMTGPAIVEAIDAFEPASTSSKTMTMLRNELGFNGLIVTDDLDAPSTTLERDLGATAIASIAAGANLLLLPGGSHVSAIALSLTAQGSRDPVFAAQLADSASRVRDLAGSLVGLGT